VKARPHPVATAAGLAVLRVIVAVAMMPIGFCLAWVSDTVFGVKP